MDCSPQGSSIHGIFQARVLKCQWALALGKPAGLLWVGPGLPVQQAGPTWIEVGCRGPGLHVPPCYIPSPSTPGPGAEKTGCPSCPLCPSHQLTANWSPAVLSGTGFVFFPVKVWGFSPGLQPACDAVQRGRASVLLMVWWLSFQWQQLLWPAYAPVWGIPCSAHSTLCPSSSGKFLTMQVQLEDPLHVVQGCVCVWSHNSHFTILV